MDSRAVEGMLGYARKSWKQVIRDNPRLPAPVACRVSDRARLWRREDIVALPGPGEMVQCAECGRRFRSLGPHLARAHGVTAEEYREAHQIPATRALMGEATRSVLAEHRRALMITAPDVVLRMRAATPPLSEVAAASAAKRAITDQWPAVRAARAAAARETQPLAVAARRVMPLGYQSIEAALAATDNMSARQASQHLGVSPSTVGRWRRRRDRGADAAAASPE